MIPRGDPRAPQSAPRELPGAPRRSRGLPVLREMRPRVATRVTEGSPWDSLDPPNRRSRLHECTICQTKLKWPDDSRTGARRAQRRPLGSPGIPKMRPSPARERDFPKAHIKA